MPAPRFDAPFATETKVLSTVLPAILLVAVAAATRNVTIIAIYIVGLFVIYAFSPRAYTVDGRTIIVHRLLGSVRIPLNGLRDVRAAGGDDLRGCIRLWANGGLFGYYGIFRTKGLGISRWYVTNRRHAVVVITEAKKYVLSPGDVEGFLAAVRSASPILADPERIW
jgi:hypothetical protein